MRLLHRLLSVESEEINMAIKGAIIGDIIGSQYEFKKPKEFNYQTAPLFSEKCRFTDDTILTLATKSAILHNTSFAEAYKTFGRKYEEVGFGGFFYHWLMDDTLEGYNSFGNGSAMRVSYVADYYNKLEDVLKYSEKTAICTHNHPEGIKGAKVIAKCIWMAKNGLSKEEILKYAIEQYPSEQYIYSPQYSIKDIKDRYKWNDTCQGSVPVAIRCVYESNTYIEFIRNVFKLNCDMDTICTIGGGIAEELFGGTGLKDDDILKKFLDDELYIVLNE